MSWNSRSPSRWAWLLPAAAVAVAAACDNSLQGISRQATWGIVLQSATKSGAGAHFTSPQGLFFKGNLSSVPNADFAGDTCADGVLNEDNDLQGVTYLDAGPSVTAALSGSTLQLARTTTSQGITYQLASPVQFQPGDSILVTIPGVSGGYPAGTIRAKTAEAFSFPTDIVPPGGSETILLNWSAPQDARSAMIVSLRYMGTGSSTFNRHVLCSFQDDGIDSIPFRWHQNWSASSGERSVVATRLRTSYVAAGDANLGVISTYQVPTPPQP